MNITTLVIIALSAIIGAFVVGWAGFLYKPKVSVPSRQSLGDVPRVPPPDGFPPVLLHALEANFGAPLPTSSDLVAWGRGRIVAARMPLLGPLWAPLVWTLNLTPGRNFVLETRLSWFGRIFVIGTEELRHGHGRFDLGERVIENANLDLSETTLLYVYSSWFSPFSLLAGQNVTWQAIDDRRVQASVPFADGENHHFDLSFNPQSSILERIDTTRTTSREGNSLPFHAVFSKHRSFDESFVFPTHLYLHWDKETPYMHLDLSGVRYNVDLSDLMETEPEVPPEPE